MGRGEELASSEFMSVKRAASHISAKRKFMRKRRNEVTSKRLYCEAIQEEAQERSDEQATILRSNTRGSAGTK